MVVECSKNTDPGVIKYLKKFNSYISDQSGTWT